MRKLRKIAFFIFPVVFFYACFSPKQVKKPEKTSLSKEEFMFDAFFLEGLRLKTIGNFEESLANFEKAREYEPENPVLHYQLSEVNTLLGNLNAAIHYAENATKLDADNVWYHVLLVQLYQNGGLLAKAAGELEEIIRLEPRRLDFYFMLSKLYQSIGKPYDAIDAMNRAEKEFGIIDVISVEKETIYIGEKKYDKAVKEVDALIKAYPDEIRYLALKAELYLNIHERNKAKEIYEKLAQADITDGTILFAMSDFYQSNQEYDKAFGLLKRAFADENFDLDIKIEMLVSILTTSGVSVPELNSQKELFDVLLKTHPAEPKAKTIYSDYLVKAGNYQEARNMLRDVLSTVRDKYLIWEQLLFIDNSLSDFDALLLDSDTVIELFPVQPVPYLFNSLAAFQAKNDEKAVKSAETGLNYVIGEKSMKVDLLTYMGEAYHRLENYTKADSVFDEILIIDPNNVYILNNYAYYLSLRAEKLDKAEKMGEKLIRLEPKNGNYLDTYAWVLYRKGNYTKAKEIIEKSLIYGGNERTAVLEHCGDIFYKLGEKTKAQTYWKDALKKAGETATEELKKKVADGEM